MIKNILVVIMLCAVLAFSKYWIGVCIDDEFDEKRIFIKHRPVWQTLFYSPRGMSDMKLSEMTEDKKREQLLYDEFVLGNHAE